jgi:hypothetical protein
MKRFGYLSLLLISGSLACVAMGISVASPDQPDIGIAGSPGDSSIAANAVDGSNSRIELWDESGDALPAGPGYDISWHTTDGGGGTSTGSDYALSGTIGQPDAGVMSGGDYELAGGFWGGAATDGPDCPIPADLNCDGAVDGADLLILLSAWGDCPNPGNCPADLNSDGAVDGADLLLLLSNWG